MSDDIDYDRLKSMQDEFDKAEADDDPFALPEPGDYQALVDGFEIIDSKVGLLFKTRFGIVNDTKYTGRNADLLFNLEQPGQVSYLKAYLVKLGAEVEGLDLARDLRPGSDFLQGLLDVPVEIAIRDSKKMRPGTDPPRPYRNVYFNQRLGEKMSDLPGAEQGEFEHVPSGQKTADESDIPF